MSISMHIKLLSTLLSKLVSQLLLLVLLKSFKYTYIIIVNINLVTDINIFKQL